ncbi:MAG TPA: sodium:proton antiporter [Tepidisphaeraceae bacterium]|jgi:NhaP-type Na+/H+ or K+/H+ antiporter
MQWTIGYIAVGLLLIGMALGSTLVKRLPLTASVVYLLIGIALGPAVSGVIDVGPLHSGPLWERLTEIGVLLSLFTAGLKLRVPLTDRLWVVPLRLATVSMMLTVGGIAVAGVLFLRLDWGTAILLGAILAPTDPVLASDVSVTEVGDTDRVRFSLTGEAGMNDGTAFPFVFIGLWMLGHHAPASSLTQLLLVELVWGTAGSIVVGAVIGTAVGYLVLHLRQKHKAALGLEEFLSLGVLALSYGVAHLVHTLGFVAVFVAGLALRRVESKSGDVDPKQLVELDPLLSTNKTATDPGRGAAYLTQAVLGFNEQLERLYEVTVVVLIGALLTPAYLYPQLLWFLPLLFLVIRPAAVYAGTIGSSVRPAQRLLIGWFGVRGVGSIYYLAYAVAHGLPHSAAQQMIGMTLMTVAASILLHGISVTPLLKLYERSLAPKAAP